MDLISCQGNYDYIKYFVSSTDPSVIMFMLMYSNDTKENIRQLIIVTTLDKQDVINMNYGL